MLSDWASPRVRRLVHRAVLLIAALFVFWQAAEGDFLQAALALAAAVYAEANKVNTPDVPETSEVDDSDSEAGDSEVPSYGLDTGTGSLTPDQWMEVPENGSDGR